MDLEEWTVNYVKHKNMMKAKVQEIERSGNELVFKFPEQEKTYLLEEELGTEVLDLKAEEPIVVSCLNTEKNFNFLIDNWKKLKEKKGLRFLFANVEDNKKWQVRPYIHDRVADEDNLEDGLKTVFKEAS